MKEAWIIDAARTPRGVGKIGKGALTEVHPQRILSTVLKALGERNNLDSDDIDDVIAGCGTQFGKQGACIARMAALDAGWKNTAPGFSLDRFCGSGLTAVNLAAMGVMSGMQDLVVAGGVESMSYGSSLPRAGGATVDSNNLHLREIHPQPHQGICADLIATLEGISREDTDKLALESQRRADHAIRNGHFAKSLVPVYHDDGRLALDKEEFPRPGTTLESLAGLKPAFAAMYDFPLDEEGLTYKKLVQKSYPDVQINHIHHAGNSSGVVDGAGAVVIASPEYAKAHGLKPRARILSVATAGDSPELMLNAPVPATKKALQIAGMSLKDIDLIEINEAFAAVGIASTRELALDPARVNVNGGAIAIGHPLGMSGARIALHLALELGRRGGGVGAAALCGGGGQGSALILRVPT